MHISNAIRFIWMAQGPTDEKSILVLVMAWCRQAIVDPDLCRNLESLSHSELTRSELSLQRRHNAHNGGSNHRRLDCLFNRLFGRRSKKHQSPASLALLHKGPVTRKMLPFDNVIICHICAPEIYVITDSGYGLLAFQHQVTTGTNDGSLSFANCRPFCPGLSVLIDIETQPRRPAVPLALHQQTTNIILLWRNMIQLVHLTGKTCRLRYDLRDQKYKMSLLHLTETS